MNCNNDIFLFTTCPPELDLPNTENLQYVPFQSSEGKQWRLIATNHDDFLEQYRAYKQYGDGAVSLQKFSYLYKCQVKQQGTSH